MNVRKVLAFSVAALALPLAAPALAQSTLHVGATVTDPQGGTVGTITAVNGATLTLHTDRHDIPLPVASFTATASNVLFGMTQAALDAAFEQAAAAAAQAFQVGAVLHDNTGAVVGPITELNAETATVSIGANVLRVPRGALQPAQGGGLAINATLAQLRAASVPAPPPQPAPAPAPAPAATPSH
jgi:hypothetical protein